MSGIPTPPHYQLVGAPNASLSHSPQTVGTHTTCNLLTATCQLPPANCQLPPANCQLPPANYQNFGWKFFCLTFFFRQKFFFVMNYFFCQINTKVGPKGPTFAAEGCSAWGGNFSSLYKSAFVHRNFLLSWFYKSPKKPGFSALQAAYVFILKDWMSTEGYE